MVRITIIIIAIIPKTRMATTDTSFEKNNKYSIKYSIDKYHYVNV